MLKKLLVLMAWVVMGSVCLAEIRQADSLKPIENELLNCDTDSLILLDIGGTLLSFKDAVLHADHEAWKRAWFQKNCPNLSLEKLTTIICAVETGIDTFQLVDPNWPEFIENAKNHNLKVVAFTKCYRDSQFKGLRISKLRSFDLQIQDSLPGPFVGQTFEYAEGVIETDAKLKGPVLQEVLSHLSWKPSKIIFVDDRFDQIESVNESCLALGIPCIAFHFASPNNVTAPLDETIADFQLRTLVEERLWIPQTAFTKEKAMKNFTVVQKPVLTVVGIACRTSNAPEAGPIDIPEHWGKFFKEYTISKIPNKSSNEIIALYCDYEGDHTQPYTLVIGCPVNSVNHIPEGMVVKTIPAGKYALFTAAGSQPQSTLETWGTIWQTDLPRTYSGDWELYGDRYFSGSPQEVDLFIAIQ